MEEGGIKPKLIVVDCYYIIGLFYYIKAKNSKPKRLGVIIRAQVRITISIECEKN